MWTVNTREQLHLCRELGVAAVITDRPRDLIGWLSAARAVTDAS